MEIHKRTMNRSQVASPSELEMGFFSTPLNSEVNHSDDSFYKEAYSNTPNVALFRVKFDTLAIVTANKFCISTLGFTTLNEMIEANMGMDEFFAIREVPFIIEELEIFGKIVNFQIQTQNKQGLMFWSFFSGKISSDNQYIDCSFIRN
ncbi:hypothetical protein NEF87_003646 [Candidatus Lokiarchaeum ossiferum]|uniref:PAS domain-containing protein n=1 Tax=Candidatus Lokiarchaeum ossiferum TaxID=2951803 RepID=A0ABY6HVD6_9ARCH|nr:hypothetical protein NEF87_003646 [Candidatus Lokiarchaeum sp. B-35]